MYIGIDPGLDGGIVTLDGTGTILAKYITPVIKGVGTKREYNLSNMKILLQEHPNIKMVILEKQQVFPGQGTVSMFRIGLGYGMWQGLIVGLGLPYTLVHSKRWQKIMLADVNKNDTKQAAALVASRLYPGIDFRATPRCKDAHEGIVDALLMSVYALRIFK